MAFIPRVESLRSSFTTRGDFYQNSFSNRFGGSPFSSPFGTPTFDFSSLTKQYGNVVPTDSKTVSSKIAESIDQRTAAPTYTPPTPQYSRYGGERDDITFSMADAIDDQGNVSTSSAYKSIAAPKEDALINAAAALQTTTDGATNSIFNPDLLKTLSGLQTEPPSPTPPIQQKTEEPDYTPITTAVTAAVTAAIVDDGVPLISKQFNDTLDDVYEEIESIDVSGQTGDEEEIDSIDVAGGRRGEEGACCKKVSTEVANLAKTVEEQAPDTEWERFKQLYLDFYGGENAGAMLREFNARERGENSNEIASPTSQSDSRVSNQTDEPIVPRSAATPEPADEPMVRQSAAAPVPEPAYEPVVRPSVAAPAPEPAVIDTPMAQPTQMSQDILDILKAQEEKLTLLVPEESAINMQATQESAPIIVNNNNVVNPNPIGMPRTERVFSDDHTFNRLSFADSMHPQYSGFVMEP